MKINCWPFFMWHGTNIVSIDSMEYSITHTPVCACVNMQIGWEYEDKTRHEHRTAHHQDHVHFNCKWETENNDRIFYFGSSKCQSKFPDQFQWQRREKCTLFMLYLGIAVEQMPEKFSTKFVFVEMQERASFDCISNSEHSECYLFSTQRNALISNGCRFSYLANWKMANLNANQHDVHFQIACTFCKMLILSVRMKPIELGECENPRVSEW